MIKNKFDQMTRRSLATAIAAGMAGMVAACGDLSPSNIQNPNLTDGQFIGTTGAAASWLLGTQRQFLTTLNGLIQQSENVSDNYYNNYTTNNQLFDNPQIENFDSDVTSLQSNVARLRKLATYAIDSLFPRDTTVTANMKAENLFYRGMANLWAGESFTSLPAVPMGPVLDAKDHLLAAVADFTQARTLSTDAAARNSYTLALARTYYRLGDRAKAVQEAQALLAASAAFTRLAQYDATNGPTNGMTGLLTSSVNNFQPLPRLDFLDPKYPNRGPTTQSPIAFLKAEEAHLIIAEALLFESNVAAAKDRLKQLLALVATRAVETVDGTLQKRGRAGGKVIYPNTSDTRVAFAPDQPMVSGLVLTRATGMRIPTTSGTSVTAAQIDAATTVDGVLYLLCLMRQEIFLAEGRRMADLGIRFPLAQAELNANPLADAAAVYTKAQLPPFVPTGFQMDAFTYDQTAKTVVIKVDMNRILVQNKTSPLVLPLLK
jgi:hypothetical protein